MMSQLLRGLLVLMMAGWTAAAAAPARQGQVVAIGILPFQDDSGTSAPAEFLLKAGQEFRLKLTRDYKDVLGRLLSAELPGGVAAAGLDALAAWGRQQGVKLVMRGGLLAAMSAKSGDTLSCRLEVYCDLVDADTRAVSSFRAEGEAVESPSALDDALRWESYSWASSDFAKSALGQALNVALGRLAEQVHAAAVAPAAAPAPPAQVVESQPPAESGAAPPPVDPYQADQELQQLIAQAESLIMSGASASLDITPLQQSLDGLRTSMDNKLALMQQAQDTMAADQEILGRKQDLQNLINSYTQQLASNPPSAESLTPGAGHTDSITKINSLIDSTLNLLQKIQEIRAALGGSHAEQGAAPTETYDTGGEQYAAPVEEETSSVEGIVTEDGAPVEGATVTDPETGVSATTDSQGGYVLPGLPGGRIGSLQVVKGGRILGKSRVELSPGRTAISDWTLSSGGTGTRSTSGAILPSGLVLSGRSGAAGTGSLQGVVRDGQGKPVPHALVSVPGLGVLRTDTQGRYSIVNVPPGNYQVRVQRSGVPPQTQPVSIQARKTAQAPILYKAKGAAGGPAAAKPTMLTPGANTVLKGRTTDEGGRALGGVKITLVHAGGALRVYSNNGGMYEMSHLKEGAYRLLATKPGYADASGQVTLKKNKPARQDFKLKKSSSAGVQKALASQQQKQALAQKASTSGGAASAGKAGGLTTKAAGGSQSGAKTLTGATKTTSETSDKSKTTDKSKTAEKSKTATTLSKSAPKATTARTAAVAAAPGRVQGTVKDAKTGRPIAGATVSIKGKPSTQTGGSGQFSFSDVPAGSYSVSARKSGYKSGGSSVTVRAGQTAAANVALTPNVVVPKTTAPIRTIKRSD